MSEPTPEQLALLERGLNVLPPRLRRIADWMLARWIGRIGLGFAWGLQRIEIFDRSMAIAAQVFTSIFPVLIVTATWFGDTDHLFANSLGIPAGAADALSVALNDSSSSSFGVIGAIIVLASATSLSRALGRAFSTIWHVPKPKYNVSSAWRWVAVVLALAITFVVLRQAKAWTNDLPPPELWLVIVLGILYAGMAILIPFVLVMGHVSVRGLLPGALIFAIVMVAVRPFADIWLPHALQTSALRYGAIGVAFTYLAWFYLVSWIYLAAAVLGKVIITDPGKIGTWLAGPKPLMREFPHRGERQSFISAGTSRE